MIDFNNFLITPTAVTSSYVSPTGESALYLGGASTNDWQVWKKPRHAKMIHIFCVGSGGAGGASINTSTTAGGGAGGGSGTTTTVRIPTFFVPETLYILAAPPGLATDPPTSGALGSNGSASFVCFEPVTTAQLTLATAPGGLRPAGAPTATLGGSASANSAPAVIGSMPRAAVGQYSTTGANPAGPGGSSTTAGTTQTIPNFTNFLTGGAGGGGSNGGTASFAGGAFTGIGLRQYIPDLPGGAAGTASAPGGNGSSYFDFKHGIFFGGSGGGGCGTAAGFSAGAGGDGAPGCGGGGAGGSNTTNPTLARGGHGGPGFVIIIAI